MIDDKSFSLRFLAGGASGYLRIVAPDMTDGDYVEIQCEGASAEEEGRIEWYFNNRVRTQCILYTLLMNEWSHLTFERNEDKIDWFSLVSYS